MDSSGFSSPRPDCFPAGLRVLVVDDDPTWLKILEKMLKKCNYEVTTCNLARDALNLLRERKDGFDIVISDVNMPDMDGFKLLEHVGLEMDLPVIMMSVDGETSRVMKGVQHGACDYLLKPIRMKELRNIWQHVFRKRMHEIRDIEGHDNLDEIHQMMMRQGNEQSEDFFLFTRDVVSPSGKKRKDDGNKHDDRVGGDSHSAKKARVVWTVDLHQKFVKAVNQIGFEKVGPKKILDLMGVPWLTRENVASHLQKYRLYLTRLQKENELKAATFGNIKHSDFSPKDSSANVCKQSPILQNSGGNITVPVHKTIVKNDGSKICEQNLNGLVPILVAGPEKSLIRDNEPDVPRNGLSFNFSDGPLNSSVESEHKIQVHYSWNPETPSVQLKHEQKPHFQSQQHRFDHHTSNRVILSTEAADKLIQVVGFEPSNNTKNTGQGLEKVTTKVESTAAFFSDCHATDQQIPCSVWNNKNNDLFDDVKSSQGNLIVEMGSSALNLWNEEFDTYSCEQVGLYPNIADLGNIEPMGFYSSQELVPDASTHLYPTWSVECEYSTDSVEYPIIDQGLFIA